LLIVPRPDVVSTARRDLCIVFVSLPQTRVPHRGDIGVMSKKDAGKGRKQRQETVRTHQLCEDCPAKCCHTLLIPFKKPRTRSMIDYYKWHVQYDTVQIAIHLRRWHLVIKGRCIYLNEKNLCSIYDNRPDTCHEHNPPACEHYGGWYDVMIDTPEELEAYFEKEKQQRKKRRA